MKTFDAIILGAGASGMWCAKTAAARGLSVCLVDHARKPGKKIRIAGGGKCNFTNLHVHPGDYTGANPHFCKSALARFSPWHMVEYLSVHDIGWEERDHGQLFCTGSADELACALEADCTRHGVRWMLRHTVQNIAATATGYTVCVSGTEGMEELTSSSLVIALGGPAWPQAGATDMGHRVARQFRHPVLPARPALVPFAMPGGWPLHGLSGIAVPAAITCAGRRFEENLLFTHTGISGPAVLHASCLWQPGMPLEMDFLPGLSVEDALREAGGKPLVRTVLGRLLPERLALALVPEKLGGMQVAQLSRQDTDTLHQRVHAFTITPARTEGMRRAEVTAGGVDTGHISSKTMESTLQPGLYFIGEVLDVTGQLGGFNLHWAWASGQAAGQALRPASKE